MPPTLTYYVIIINLNFQIEPPVGVVSQSWAERRRCAVDDSDEEGEGEDDPLKTLTSTVDVDAIKVRVNALDLASKMLVISLGISFQRSPPQMMRPPPPPPPPKPAASNKLMTIPEDWDKSGVAASISARSAGGGAIASTSSSSASLSSSAANPAPNKHGSDESDDSGSESDDSTSNDTSDSDECSGSSSSTCSSTDSECSCSGSSCDQSRPSPSVRYSSSKKGGNGGGGVGAKEKAAAAVASSPSYAIAATKSRVLPTATTSVASTSPSPMPRPVPVGSIKTEHRSMMMSVGVGDDSGAPSNVIQGDLARPSANSVLEMAPVAAVPAPKRKSLVAAAGKTNAMGNHLMVSKEVPILPPPPIALLQTIPATSIVFKSEPIYISQAESCIGGDGINSLVPGAVIQSTRCSGGGRIAPKAPIPKDSASMFSKPVLPLMPPPVTTKAASVAAVGAGGGGGGVKRTEFRLRPESDILKQSVVRAAAAAAAVSIPGRSSSGSAPVIGPRVKSSGSRKKKSSATDKVSSSFKKLLFRYPAESVLTNRPHPICNRQKMTIYLKWADS